jgi:hypothetical protein
MLVVDYIHLVGEEEGGSPITSYQVQWDQGTDSFVDLDENMLSQISVSGVSGGVIYAFRYRAVNRQGPGEYS